MDHSKELKHISLCAGYGGLDLGLERALGSIRTVCFVEIESFAIKNLVSKIEKRLLSSAPIFTDLKKFPWELFNGKVDILSGGFPCQPFSNAGRRQGDQDPRHLWPFITKGIEHLGRPPIVFFENVSGIISSKLKGNDWQDEEGTPVLLHVLRELERLGYQATAGIFSAAEVGAPHQRKRVFILGVRNELGSTGINLINGLIESNKSDRNPAWPATRGQGQYWHEPPRVALGDTLHDGLLDPKESRNTNEASDNNTQGQESTVKLKGASRPGSNRSIQKSELANASRGDGNERAWSKTRSLQEKKKLKKADRAPRDNHARQSKVCWQSEPQVGGDTHGASNWLDYAMLFESCESRTDELRLLGNGVVPETAAKAFKLLWERLTLHA